MPPFHARVPRTGRESRGAQHRTVRVIKTRARDVLVVLRQGSEAAETLFAGITQANARGPQWRLCLDSEGRALRDTRWFSSSDWAGVIALDANAPLRLACAGRRIPLIELNAAAAVPTTAVVRSNDEAVGRFAAQHVLGAGAPSAGFCGIAGDFSSQRRREAFLKAVYDAGLLVPAVIEPEPPGLETRHAHRQQIRLIARWLLNFKRGPVAVVAANAARARQVVLAAGVAGLAVPADVSVLALSSDAAGCAASLPPVDSIDVGAGEAGSAAVESLARWLAGEPVAGTTTELPPKGLIVRASGAPIRTGLGFVSRAMAFIDACGPAIPTLAEVVKQSKATRWQLEHAFRRYLGRSPQQEIRRIKLERLCRLLESSSDPLAIVADKTGFKHVEYLSVFFKRATGQSPGAYRRRAQAPEAKPQDGLSRSIG